METINLTGHFLIAMPALTDPYFSKSVTFICSHNQDGAMGVVINQPTDLTFHTLFEKINLKLENAVIADQPVLFGGPVQPDRGFVLHSTSGLLNAIGNVSDAWDSSLLVAKHTALTTSKDILEAVAIGNGPENMLLALGYAGWTAGQLEQEIAQNAWLSVQATNVAELNTILYDTDYEHRHKATLALLGVDPAMLSDVAGHA